MPWPSVAYRPKILIFLPNPKNWVGLTVVNVCAVKNCFDRQVTKYISIKVYTFLYFSSFLLTLLDRPDCTEIKCLLINMMNCLIDLCTPDSSVCAPYALISSYGQAQKSIHIS